MRPIPRRQATSWRKISDAEIKRKRGEEPDALHPFSCPGKSARMGTIAPAAFNPAISPTETSANRDAGLESKWDAP
jgi:hypothetical protein